MVGQSTQFPRREDAMAIDSFRRGSPLRPAGSRRAERLRVLRSGSCEGDPRPDAGNAAVGRFSMSTRAESLPANEIANRTPLPGSRKVYVGGPGGMRVPFREIGLSPTRGARGEVEINPPLRVYDTSGPYTDPDVAIDLHQGLVELRRPWILARASYEETEPVRPGAPDLALTRPRRVLRCRGNATQMHFARRGDITPEMEFVALRENMRPDFVRDE